MRILIYGINYAPELTGIGKYTGEMAQWLAARGHQVVVVTAPPYYPEWSIHQDHRNAYSFEHSGTGTPKVIRAPLYVPTKPKGFRRLLHLASFMGTSFPILLARGFFFRPHLVLTIEPSFVCVLGALLLAGITGAVSWLHVQDFEIDAGFEFGFMPAHVMNRRLAFGTESIFLRKFNRVSSISAEMVERSQGKGVAKTKTVLFPNWVDVEHIYPMAGPNRFRLDHGLNEKTVVLYSGNMGNKQGLEMLAPLARAFAAGGRYDDSAVHFVFCGDGSFRSELESLVTGMSNVTMLNLQPYEDLNELLNAADVHLLPQRAKAAKLFMPSKLTGMLASGRPVLATADPETQLALVIGSGASACGVLVPPENSAKLHEALARLVADPHRRKALAANARAYAIAEMSREEVLQRFERNLYAALPHATRRSSISRSPGKVDESSKQKIHRG